MGSCTYVRGASGRYRGTFSANLRDNGTAVRSYNDDPFQDQLYAKLSGNSGMALGLMLPMNLPIVFGWMIYRRLFGNKRK